MMKSLSRSPAFPELDEADRATMLEVSRNWLPDIQASRRKVCDIYDAAFAKRKVNGIRCEKDQPYGEDARQCMDIYTPESISEAHSLPVVIFVHGGGFIRGNKDSTPYIYANVPQFFASEGYIAVNIEYRLAPAAAYPAGAEDVALSIDWLRQNIAKWGGNPENMVIFGHSAGGSHVANYLTDPLFEGRSSGIVAAIIASGRMDADTFPDNPNANGVKAYYGETAELQQQRSPMTHAARMHLPLMLAIAEFENPYLDRYGLEYAARVAANGNIPRVIQLPYHNHTSIVAHIGLHDGYFEAELLRFIETYIA